jgi:hypothetical protein
MKSRTRYRRGGIALAAFAVCAIVAGTAWAAQPKNFQRLPQETPATRSASQQNTPPQVNRQVDRQSPPQLQSQALPPQFQKQTPPPQFQRQTPPPQIQRQTPPPQFQRQTPSQVQRSSNDGPRPQTRRDTPPSSTRNLTGGDTPTRLAQQIAPLTNNAGKHRLDTLKDVKVPTAKGTPSGGQNEGTSRQSIKDARDSGTKAAGANQTPINRQPVKDSGKGSPGGVLPVKGSGDAKSVKSLSPVNKSLPANKSAINDVRNRLGGPKGPKTIQPQPGQRTTLDATNAAKLKTAQANAFQERLKSGDLKRVTVGETAQKLKLAEQYRMYGKGDVARRLNLQAHGAHPVVLRGVISPLYQHQCIRYHYWGPSFFAGVCWYPRWNPWVQWSWRYHCRSYWDPRPFWCRPVVYLPCPVWVYWRTPAWRPLPEVACGTWVDLRPVEIPVTAADLQLLAVRFVDPGHPDENLGPRYRVWFRNNGSLPITQPFNVMLFAANNERLAADLPQAGVRVTSIDAGDVQSVDVRLPVEVYAMRRDAQGNPLAFSVLQVLVDANREVAEATEVNNGATLAPAEILPVDPASFELQPVAARPGEEILLAGEGFGPQPGRVLVQINGREMDGEILGWYDLGVRWTLPKLALAAPVEADVVVIRGDGAAANPLKVTLTP